MQVNIYQVDAFTTRVFEGNPAAVCPLDAWLSDTLLQHIAEENNLSETAFFVPTEKGFHLRWFTPVEEVDLCGHATLASAFVIFNHLQYVKPEITFSTLSGDLIVRKTAQGLQMDFPSTGLEITTPPQALIAGLGFTPKLVLKAFDYVVVCENEEQVVQLQPDFYQWLQLDLRGVVVTAPGRNVDFVSRSFFPKLRINEDPVTGAVHCELAPFWGEKLGTAHLKAKQLSKRGGMIECLLQGERVLLFGQAVDYMQGRMTLPVAG